MQSSAGMENYRGRLVLANLVNPANLSNPVYSMLRVRLDRINKICRINKCVIKQR